MKPKIKIYWGKNQRYYFRGTHRAIMTRLSRRTGIVAGNRDTEQQIAGKQLTR